MAQYRGIALPDAEGFKRLMSAAKKHNSDNCFFIDRDTGKLRTQLFVSKNAEIQNEPAGCYQVNVPRHKINISHEEMQDAIKGYIDLALDIGGI